MRHRNRYDYLAKVTNFVFVFVIDNIIEDCFPFYFVLFPFGWTIQSISLIHTNLILICTVLIVSELKQKWFNKPIDKKKMFWLKAKQLLENETDMSMQIPNS